MSKALRAVIHPKATAASYVQYVQFEPCVPIHKTNNCYLSIVTCKTEEHNLKQ